jgi:hypothetical protein
MPQCKGCGQQALGGSVHDYLQPMRWDNLFDDLEGQLERELSAEESDVHAEEERLRLARLSLRERIMALRSLDGSQKPLRVTLIDGQSVVVLPSAFGRDWFSADLVDDSVRRARCIVPLGAIASLMLTTEQIVHSLGSALAPPNAGGARGVLAGDTDSLSARLGLPFVLRDLCRRRAAVDVVAVSGRHHGTIDRVGRDHFDLAEHERGVARRTSAVSGCRIIPISQLSLVVM